jgi:hypothetical protein
MRNSEASEAAPIRCTKCDCEITYTGPYLVGEKLCGNCDHPLKGLHKFLMPSARMVLDDRVPDDFFTVPEFK